MTKFCGLGPAGRVEIDCARMSRGLTAALDLT
jgi:hypothetical protein